MNSDKTTRVAMLTLFLPILIGMPAAADTSSPVFDVASVKVNNTPGRPRPTIQFSPDTLTMRQVSLWLSLRWVYGADDPQISGPDFLQGPPIFDIVAKAAGPVPENQMRLMLRTLLAQRFHLTLHHEKKEMTVMALLVAKGGPRVRESDGKYDLARGMEMPTQFLGYSDDVHLQRNREPNGRLQDSFSNMPMALFATVLEAMGSKTPQSENPALPVVDMTGLPGRFDLTIVHELPQGHEGDGQQAADDVLGDLKPLLEKQLGLTLERRKAMVDVLVVDHADQSPTAN